jgi:predicted esterase
MHMTWPLAATGLLLSLSFASVGSAEPFPAGPGEQRVKLEDATLTVFSYRPNCPEPALMIVFHGQNRNANDYRDWSRPLADAHCLLVAAPRFAKDQFPRWRYQHGGIVRDGVMQDRREWTGRIVLELVERIRELEGRNMTYTLLGHSAGAQFLSRVVAFTPTEAQRIVIANPGTHVFPDPKVKAPYGFGGVFANDAMTEALRRYLGQPITIFLGQDDRDDGGLNTSRDARAQGPTRYARGRRAFKAAEALAQSHRWPFNWRLVELTGVDHSAKRMFASPDAAAAVRP